MAISIDGGIGPDFDGGAIRANTSKREGGSHVDVGWKSGGCLPGTPGKDAFGLLQPFHRNVMGQKIWCARQAVRRLAGHHAHRLNVPFRSGCDCIKTEQRARGDTDLSAALFGQSDQLGPWQQRSSRQNHDGFAGLQHRPANILKGVGRGTFNHQIGIEGQLHCLDDRAANTLGIKPAPRFGPIAYCDTGKLEARDAVGKLAREHTSNRAQTGYCNPGRQWLDSSMHGPYRNFYAGSALLSRSGKRSYGEQH